MLFIFKNNKSYLKIEIVVNAALVKSNNFTRDSLPKAKSLGTCNVRKVGEGVVQVA